MNVKLRNILIGISIASFIIPTLIIILKQSLSKNKTLKPKWYFDDGIDQPININQSFLSYDNEPGQKLEGEVCELSTDCKDDLKCLYYITKKNINLNKDKNHIRFCAKLDDDPDKDIVLKNHSTVENSTYSIPESGSQIVQLKANKCKNKNPLIPKGRWRSKLNKKYKFSRGAFNLDTVKRDASGEPLLNDDNTYKLQKNYLNVSMEQLPLPYFLRINSPAIYWKDPDSGNLEKKNFDEENRLRGCYLYEGGSAVVPQIFINIPIVLWSLGVLACIVTFLVFKFKKNIPDKYKWIEKLVYTLGIISIGTGAVLIVTGYMIFGLLYWIVRYSLICYIISVIIICVLLILYVVYGNVEQTLNIVIQKGIEKGKEIRDRKPKKI